VQSEWLNHNPETDTSRVFHWDDVAEEATIETRQDITGLVEVNKALYNESASGKELRKVASIPLALYFDLKKQGIIDDQARFKKWLNDRDNLVFRTHEGRV
jgi:hypothetical protein